MYLHSAVVNILAYSVLLLSHPVQKGAIIIDVFTRGFQIDNNIFQSWVNFVDLKKSMAALDGWFYFNLSLQFRPHINHRKKCVDLRLFETIRQTFFLSSLSC